MFHGVVGLVPSSFLVEWLSTKPITWVQKIMIGQILMFKTSDFSLTFFKWIYKLFILIFSQIFLIYIFWM
jgi:hypothetical protein